MRNYFLAAFAAPLILFWSNNGWCQDTESALGDPVPAAVADPSLANSRAFPPAMGTSGVAAIAPAPSARRGPAATCGPANPCATPTPARDRVVVAGP